MLTKRKKRVRFDKDACLIPPNHAADTQQQCWYTGMQIRAFQSAVDQLQKQLAAQAVADATSWPSRYQALYQQATTRNGNSTTEADLVQLDDLDAYLGLDLLGMERLATDHILQDARRRRRHHLRTVLATQNTAPYNNASRLRQAIATASLETSRPAQTWARVVAQQMA